MEKARTLVQEQFGTYASAYATSRVHAHHEDYDYPLDVIWLCPIHHKARHKELAATGWDRYPSRSKRSAD